MGFDTFLGNERIVRALRGMLGRGRVPSALLFTGPRGIGKYTLARMFAAAANCQRLTDDFCGECDSCLRMASLAAVKLNLWNDAWSYLVAAIRHQDESFTPE